LAGGDAAGPVVHPEGVTSDGGPIAIDAGTGGSDAEPEKFATSNAVQRAAPDAGAARAVDAGNGHEPGLPVTIDPSLLKAQQIAGTTNVPASAATKACMKRYHLDSLQGTVGLCVDENGAVTA